MGRRTETADRYGYHGHRRKVTVAELDTAIADEEVRSHMLEEERRAALNEAQTG